MKRFEAVPLLLVALLLCSAALWGDSWTKDPTRKPLVAVQSGYSADVNSTGGVAGGRFAAFGTSHTTVTAKDNTLAFNEKLIRDCPQIKLTTSLDAADYLVKFDKQTFALSSFYRFLVANANGEILVSTHKGQRTPGSGAVSKEVCRIVMADWNEGKAAAEQK